MVPESSVTYNVLLAVRRRRKFHRLDLGPLVDTVGRGMTSCERAIERELTLYFRLSTFGKGRRARVCVSVHSFALSTDLSSHSHLSFSPGEDSPFVYLGCDP